MLPERVINHCNKMNIKINLLSKGEREEFAKKYNIVHKESSFVDFFASLDFIPVGDGVEIQEIDLTDEELSLFDDFIVLGSGDSGTLVYFKKTDEVKAYPSIFLINDSLKDLGEPENSWGTFSDFLEHYYNDEFLKWYYQNIIN
ncbi:MAG: hypothetical protein QG567_2100 [Campylobacterota bacterium]|nr:hypothetical protein [Campylobacterota bacterium]